MKNKHYIWDFVFTLYNNRVTNWKIVWIKEWEYEIQYLWYIFFAKESDVFKTEQKCKNNIIRNLYKTYCLERDTLMENWYLLTK